jgi:hypothetical protein
MIIMTIYITLNMTAGQISNCFLRLFALSISLFSLVYSFPQYVMAQSPSPATPSINLPLTYENSSVGIAIQYPADWKYKSGPSLTPTLITEFFPPTPKLDFNSILNNRNHTSIQNALRNFLEGGTA